MTSPGGPERAPGGPAAGAGRGAAGRGSHAPAAAEESPRPSRTRNAPASMDRGPWNCAGSALAAGSAPSSSFCETNGLTERNPRRWWFSGGAADKTRRGRAGGSHGTGQEAADGDRQDPEEGDGGHRGLRHDLGQGPAALPRGPPPPPPPQAPPHPAPGLRSGLHPARPPALPCGAARPPSAGQSRPWALSRPVEAAAGPAPRPAPPPGAPRGVARGQTHPPWEGEGGRAVNHPGRRAGQQGAAGPASSQDNPAAS